MALTEIELPHEKTTVRRIDIAADGMIWYVNSGRGRLGRYDPRGGDLLIHQSATNRIIRVEIGD